VRLPLRLPEYRLYQKWLAAAVIATVCAAIGAALWTPAKILGAVRMLDNVFYDSLYKFRPWDSQARSSIVIIAVDASSLDAMDNARKIGWPWPRKYWGEVVTYLDSVGAKAIVFDMLFDKTSVYDRFDKDDQQFGEAIDASATPVIMASTAVDAKTLTIPTPPTNRRTLGAINSEGGSIVRTYEPVILGHDSLALATVKRLGRQPPAWAGKPFLLRYYGPHADKKGPVTFQYVPAALAIQAYEEADSGKPAPLPPDAFKDKIVLIGAITKATYDQKSSPLSSIYPGTEIHATALQNMLTNQRVTPCGMWARFGVLMLGCFVSAIGTVIPGRVPLKLVGGVAGLTVVLFVSASLFLDNDNVRWMPPSAALAAAMLSAFVGLSYSYLTELRQRRFILKAFAQSVSKEVADEIAKDPRKLGLGGQRRDMTVMFTDLANFTALTESIKDERLTAVLQFYLEEMSGVVLGVNGTVDKYIGDAIMAFWNAPTNQPDHAVRACRAALEMRARETAIQPRLLEMSGVEIYSRIGINSGTMVVGNLGSTFKFSYTVIGDSVNLASRLEGANKMYGTRILLSETTAAIVAEQFFLRKLDLLAVKGKAVPIEVFELIAERNAGAVSPSYVAPFEAALALYRQRQFERAREILVALKKDFPDDGPTDTLLGRVIEYIENPPEPEWNGVYVAKEK